MTNTARLLLVASVSMIAVLPVGPAFALPHHSHHHKPGKSDWSNGYSNDKWDDDWGDTKKKDSHGDKYAKHDWGEHQLKKDWFAWGFGKEHEKWGHDKDRGWGKDPDCDPPLSHSPEPGTVLLLGSSFAAAGLAWRRRRAAQRA